MASNPTRRSKPGNHTPNQRNLQNPTPPKPSQKGSTGNKRQGCLPASLDWLKDYSSPKNLAWLAIAMFGFLFALLVLGGVSGWLGYQSGQEQFFYQATTEMDNYLASQFEMAVDDVTAGDYELASQRLEYILRFRPDFQPAADLLTDISSIMNVTATPTALPPTATLTATPDLRPAEEMYASVLAMISLQEWNMALDTLANLRKVNPGYNIVEVDGLIFLCLRNRGLQKILNGELEGGIYDFTLAEAFAPLDGEAENYRAWARLYLLGNSFWGAYPESAAYYYGQLVAAAPNLTDASGVSAFYRYWASLAQQADMLAKEGKWCQASNKYRDVLGVWDQKSVYPTATWAFNQCLLGTPSATPTFTPTFTLEASPYPTDTLSPTLDSTPTPTNTSKPQKPTKTPTPTENVPLPTDTPAPPPTDTPVPPPTDTPLPPPTDTPVVPTDTPSGGG